MTTTCPICGHAIEATSTEERTYTLHADGWEDDNPHDTYFDSATVVYRCANPQDPHTLVPSEHDFPELGEFWPYEDERPEEVVTPTASGERGVLLGLPIEDAVGPDDDDDDEDWPDERWTLA